MHHTTRARHGRTNRLVRFVAARRVRDERGDVPGWVMITVMTITVAGAILTIFQSRVTEFLEQALNEFM